MEIKKNRHWTILGRNKELVYKPTLWQIALHMPLSKLYQLLRYKATPNAPEHAHPRHKFTIHDGDNSYHLKRHVLVLVAMLLLPVIARAQSPSNYSGSLDAQSFKTLTVSTASCSSTVIMVFSTNTARVGTLICNESTTVAVRIGPSTISTTVGQYLGAGLCLTYDKPRYYKGSVWCISTGAAAPISATEGTP